MNRTTFIAFLILILAIAGGVSWYLFTTSRASLGQAAPSPVASSTSSVDEGKAIYSNGPYGFSLVYPETADVQYEFSPTYHLPADWRANAISTGTPVLAIVPFSTESDHSYPRYFVAMVRIGASTDAKEVANCLKATPDRGETALPDVTINGTTWKAFSFQDAAMMQYSKGVSYRTIHEKTCFAMEKIETGSSYRDDPKSKDDLADEYLTQQYDALQNIVDSFTFARP